MVSQVTRPGSEQLAHATDRIANWIERSYDLLGWPDLGPPLGPLGIAANRPSWPPKAEGIHSWIHCVADGGAEQISVELSPMDAPSKSGPFLGALAIAFVAAASVWLVRWPVARDLLHRWPHAIGVLAGVIWWACLWPSWLGLLIAGGSVVLSFRPGWPGRSSRAEGSTVVASVGGRVRVVGLVFCPAQFSGIKIAKAQEQNCSSVVRLEMMALSVKSQMDISESDPWPLRLPCALALGAC